MKPAEMKAHLGLDEIDERLREFCVPVDFDQELAESNIITIEQRA